MLGVGRSWPQGFVAKEGVNSYKVALHYQWFGLNMLFMARLLRLKDFVATQVYVVTCDVYHDRNKDGIRFNGTSF